MTFAQGYVECFAGIVALAWIICWVFDYLRDAVLGPR